MTRRCRKAFVVSLWLVLSLGIYRCGADEPDAPSQPAAEVADILPMDNHIRVLIRTSDYADIYHDSLTISGTNGMSVEQGQTLTELAPNEPYIIASNDSFQDTITLRPCSGGQLTLENVTRTDTITYRGTMDCYHTADGLVLVNDLTLEEYLYGVVPSEMPSSYPTEALKAQAISARTYAYYRKTAYAYPQWEAHVDDSTAYQVYGNIAEQESVNVAVDATRGLVMTYEDDLIESFYYSTSCGYGAGYETWCDEETRAYLRGKSLVLSTMSGTITDLSDETTFSDYIHSVSVDDIEKEEPWYRWCYVKTIEETALAARIQELAATNPEQITINEPSDRRGITVTSRSPFGMAMELTVATDTIDATITTQHTIRQVLATAGDSITKQDGSTYVMGELLPSAFFAIESMSEDGTLTRLTLIGGGLGHGVGMSQNGAKCLANKGFTAEEILHYYYNGIAIEQISG